jgi:hypothetical protein
MTIRGRKLVLQIKKKPSTSIPNLYFLGDFVLKKKKRPNSELTWVHKPSTKKEKNIHKRKNI